MFDQSFSLLKSTVGETLSFVHGIDFGFRICDDLQAGSNIAMNVFLVLDKPVLDKPERSKQWLSLLLFERHAHIGLI